MMMMGGSIKLVNLFGIRIGANPTWFIVLFVVIFWLSGYFERILGGSQTEAYVVAVVSALLFFVSLIAHELGHALVARRLGIGISGIDLWLLGGVAKMTRDTRTAGEEFKVAAAGPAVTLVIVVMCALGSLVAGRGDSVLEAATFGADVSASPVLALVAFLGLMNAVLLVFNLVPAFPLDGGRIAKALAWRLTGDRIKATRVAAWLGQAFGVGLMGLGAYLLVTSDSAFDGFWWLLLGFFIFQGARAAVTSTQFAQRLEGVTVADVMDREPVAMPATTRAIDAQEDWFLRYGWDFFPAVDEAGRFVGLARQAQVDQEVAAGRPATPVGELVDGSAEDWGIRADEPIESLLGQDRLRDQGALMAVDAEGILRGVVTVEQVRRAVAAALPVR
ncbi:MAG: site-2 protease family protein [Actinomycetota bacterium]|nr:site-2 protease family protein [Actinomycetota bacterium]